MSHSAPPQFGEQLRRFLAAQEYSGVRRTFAPGERLFTAGEPGHTFHLIESGAVEIVAEREGEAPRVLATIGAGETVGEMAVIDQAPRSATVWAQTATATVELTRADLLLILQEEPSLALSLVSEITQRVRALNSKYLADMIQEERLALIGRFARTIIHDLKNPLGVLVLAADLLAHPQSAPAMRQRAQDQIGRQVERLTTMLWEISEYASPHARGRPPRRVRAPAYLGDFVSDLRQELARLPVTLEFDEAVPDVELSLDPPRITQLLSNLVYNAVDAMPEGGTVHLQASRAGDRFQITITDTGPGIPPEVAATLFEPFTTRGKPHGSGLGLAVCRKIAEDHGGQVRLAESVPGQGARFLVTLPLPAA